MRRPSARRALAVSAIALLGVGTLAACGDDDNSDNPTVEEGKAPEDVKAPMADVLAQLPSMVEHGTEAATAAASGDFDGAKEHYDELHEVWEGIEGTIKDTDEDVYERIETAQGLIKDGAESKDAARVQQGADDQKAAADEFAAAQAAAATGAGATTTTSDDMSQATLPGD